MEKYNLHHRRPRSLGGSDSPSNLSYVDKKKHNAFHIIFGNANPLQTAHILGILYKDWAFTAIPKPHITNIRFGQAGRSKNWNKLGIAFDDIGWNKKTVPTIIKEVNETWIDPDWSIMCFKKRKQLKKHERIARKPYT